MITYENECCDCATPAYPCLGDICSNRKVKHCICDECGDDVDELWDGLCRDCFLEASKKDAEYESVDR